MKRKTILAVLLLAVLLFSGCMQNPAEKIQAQGSFKTANSDCGKYSVKTLSGQEFYFDLSESFEKPSDKDVVKISGITILEKVNCKSLKVEELKIMERFVKIVEKGDTIKVDYTGELLDGNIFDTSIKEVAEKAGLPLREKYEPLQFTAGTGEMIQGFDNAVLGMKIGEEKTLTILPEQAYGAYDPDWVLVLDKNSEDYKRIFLLEPALGFALRIPLTQNGKEIIKEGLVTSVDQNSITLDFNHKLAGKTLKFWIKVLEIKKAN